MFIFETKGGTATIALSQNSLRGSKNEDSGYARSTLVVSR